MESHDLQDHYAGFVSRFIAFSLDLTLISLVGIIVSVFVGMVIQFFRVDVVALGAPGTILNSVQGFLLASGTTFTGLFGVAYFIFFWVVAGFTPGMGLLGLQVIRTSGEHVALGHAILRFFGYWISALFLFVGFLWILVDRRHQGWHDKIADTVVVYSWQLPPRL